MNVSVIELTAAGEKLIPSQNNYDKLRIFGFLVKMNKIEGTVIQITPSYRFETNSFHISDYFLNEIGNDVGIDLVRDEVQINDSRITSAFGGFSWAPVFIENKATGKWELMGGL